MIYRLFIHIRDIDGHRDRGTVVGRARTVIRRERDCMAAIRLVVQLAFHFKLGMATLILISGAGIVLRNPNPEERRISTTQRVGHRVTISIRGLDRTTHVVGGDVVAVVRASTLSATTRKVLVPSLNFGA